MHLCSCYCFCPKQTYSFLSGRGNPPSYSKFSRLVVIFNQYNGFVNSGTVLKFMTRKKEKTKHYTKKEIAQSSKSGDKSIIHSLAVKLMAGEKLTISEMGAAARKVGYLRLEGSISKVDLATIPGAQDYIFIVLFLAYHGDLEGEYGITKFSGSVIGPSDRVVRIEEKKEDVIRLNEYNEKWSKLFVKEKLNKHSDQILNTVVNEVNNDLKEIDLTFKDHKIKNEEYNYKRKGTILRSKYLYLKVKAIFEDLDKNEIEVKFNNSTIEITPWSMAHILNRHYAKAALHYDSGKSFHSDPNLKFFENPEDLKNVLEQIGSNDKTKTCSLAYIPFKLNNIIYLVHVENQVKHIKGSKIPYLRLQTFYPVEDSIELQKIQADYEEVIIDSKLIGCVKKSHSSELLLWTQQ